MCIEALVAYGFTRITRSRRIRGRDTRGWRGSGSCEARAAIEKVSIDGFPKVIPALYRGRKTLGDIPSLVGY